MAIAELDELFKSITTPEDRAAFEQLLERNPSVRDRVTSGEDLTRSLLDNDTDAAARVEARRLAATQRTQPSTSATSASAASAADRAGIDLSRVDELVAAKVRELFDNEFRAATFNDRVKSIVKTTADDMVPGLISTTTRKADEIFTIRNANLKEFGKELDTVAFTAFIEEEAKKGKTYGSYVDAHNSFVQEDRVQARIAKGIAEGVAAKTVPSVPGTTLSTGTSMASNFMRSNKMTALDTERGKAIDAGAMALRQLQTRHVE